MNIHTKTVPAHYKSVTDLGARKIANGSYTHRVKWENIPNGAGVYAQLPSPHEGHIRSFAMMPGTLAGGTPPVATGSLFVSPVNPAVDYEAFFLYAVLDDVPLTTTGPKMWRKTSIANAAYSTLQVEPGMLYLAVLDGPPDLVLADVTMTVVTG
jgi:hypothetical protein